MCLVDLLCLKRLVNKRFVPVVVAVDKGTKEGPGSGMFHVDQLVS